jgi:hypothetical protein
VDRLHCAGIVKPRKYSAEAQSWLDKMYHLGCSTVWRSCSPVG